MFTHIVLHKTLSKIIVIKKIQIERFELNLKGVTFSGKVHGLFSDRVGGPRDGEQTLEDCFRFEFRFRQHLVHRHIVQAVAFDHQRRCLDVVLLSEIEKAINTNN